MRDDISEVFAALADSTRRKLYERLLESPSGRTATELSEGALVSRQAIVKHLQVLTKTGLAEVRRHGREARYFVSGSGTLGASKWLEDSAAAWDRRLGALEKKIQATARKPKHANN
ncbi:MAG: metalloregulator ArsR/SmtB family transcription factor [Acidimicrobiales bacterium]